MQTKDLKYMFYYVMTALFWGGFTFYAGFVVPIGMKVLGNHTTMGFITKEVAIYLNIIGLCWVFSAILLSYKSTKWSILLVLGLILTLMWLHSLLSNQMNPNTLKLISQQNFYLLHRIYLIISTIIWFIVIYHFFRIHKK